MNRRTAAVEALQERLGHRFVDKNLLDKPKISDYDYNWTPVTQMGCRDLVGVNVAYFMVGPNITGGTWDPQTVERIGVTIQAIDWAE